MTTNLLIFSTVFISLYRAVAEVAATAAVSVTTAASVASSAAAAAPFASLTCSLVHGVGWCWWADDPRWKIIKLSYLPVGSSENMEHKTMSQVL